MVCQSCGTQVKDGLDVCPACHSRLDKPTRELDDGSLWCASCGSAIPAGKDACPVCGLPVEGVFGRDESEPVLPLLKKTEPAAVELVSALPPTPQDGDDKSVPSDERPRQMRLVVVSALVALALVGGTALYITKPWDPNAYVTHALTPQDHSKDNPPEKMTHLSAQDKVEDDERRAILNDAQKTMDAYQARLRSMSDEANENYDALWSYVEGGPLGADLSGSSEAVALQKELRGLSEELEGLAIDDEVEPDKRRDELLVVGGYLQGELDVLVQAWSTVKQEPNSTETVVYARSILNGSASSRGYDEWHRLFENAYESLG